MLPVAILLAVAHPSEPVHADREDLPQRLDGSRLDPFSEGDWNTLALIFVEEECPISNRYVPRINALYEKGSSGKVDFWLVYPSSASNAETATSHRGEYDLRPPALLDPNHYLVRRAQATVTPECAVFARDNAGKVELVYHGRIDNQYQDFGKWRATPTSHELRDVLVAIQKGRTPTPFHETAIGCYIEDRD